FSLAANFGNVVRGREYLPVTGTSPRLVRRLGDRTARDDRRRRCATRVHLAVTLEEDAALDDDRCGGQRSAHLAGRLDLDALRSLGVAVVFADDDERAHLDLRLHLGALADDERIGRDDFAAELPVDADGTLEDQLAFE